MKKMFFFALMAMALAACEHWPSGWIEPPLDEEDEVDSGTATRPTEDAGVDSPADAPDAEYLPDAGTPAGAPDATADSGTSGPCVCICEDDDNHDHDYGHGCGRHRGHGHYKLHCHQGGHCHQFFGEGEECERGYHCHIGHDCTNSRRAYHPECEGDTSPIYDPRDTCGNPCECPGDEDIPNGDDEDYEDDEHNRN